MAISRRTLVIAGSGAVLSAGGYAWLRQLGYEVDMPADAGVGDARTKAQTLPFAPFDPVALGVLAATIDHLIPGTDQIPSASDVGVVDYVVSAAAAPGLGAVRQEVLKLTRLMDLVSKKKRGGPFAQQAHETQASILAEIADGKHTRKTFSPARALEATLLLSLEGYLGHPYHGGNRDAAAWDALSISMPRERAPHDG